MLPNLFALGLIYTAVAALGQDDAESNEHVVRALTHAELVTELTTLADTHSDIATLSRVALSREGRSIDALRLTAAEDPSAVPALLLVGNLEGPRVFESGVVLHHVQRMARAFLDGDEAVRALLESTVVWFIPRANPDAAEGRFREPAFELWASSTGVDNDRDGRMGEDPASDVDGDGVIVQMRVLDPDGEWMEDPFDARVLIKADPAKGERGKWKLHVESRDLDGDEAYGEDPPRDARVDRNFPAGWEEHAEHAGLFPTDEPEVRGLIEFVMAQHNLCLVVVYDGQDNLVEEPESVADDAPLVKRIPAEGVLESDAELIEELGRRYREATENESTGSGEDHGTFARWCYAHRGLIALEAVLWNMPSEAPEEDTPEEEEESAADESAADESAEDDAQEADAEEDEDSATESESEPEDEDDESDCEPSEDAKHLLWVDGAGEAWRFIDWKAFEHPELGAVEVGGFAPYAKIEPPADDWPGIAQSHFDWFVGLGELLPRVEITSCEREELGDGVWRVTAVVTNDAYLPLLSRSARRTRTTRPAKILLHLAEAATLLAGSRQALLSDLAGSGGRHEYTWLVTGPAEMEIGVSVDTNHAGTAFQNAEVN